MKFGSWCCRECGSSGIFLRSGVAGCVRGDVVERVGVAGCYWAGVAKDYLKVRCLPRPWGANTNKSCYVSKGLRILNYEYGQRSTSIAVHVVDISEEQTAS
jgi:hypothetical protein